MLGARHLTQAILTKDAPGALVLPLGVELDLAHAASMLGLALLDRRRRRAGLLDATAAGVFTIAGAILAARAPATPPPVESALGRLGALPHSAARWTAQRTLPAAISHRLTHDQ
ncbi:MAG TPA: hypothetical protein VGL88_09115 [Pseudonocardiaceae bacterium]